jgi:hypothetical protein
MLTKTVQILVLSSEKQKKRKEGNKLASFILIVSLLKFFNLNFCLRTFLHLFEAMHNGFLFYIVPLCGLS